MKILKILFFGNKGDLLLQLHIEEILYDNSLKYNGRETLPLSDL